ncbi:MAG: DNA-binding protein [Pedobacter sp.]|nr:MAG: DNA-binding protein [Pedobacter sp.]
MDNQFAQLLIKQLQDFNSQLIKELQEYHLMLSKQLEESIAAQTNPTPSSSFDKLMQLENLIDEYEVKDILKISRTTLYRLKVSSQLYVIKIGQKTYYNKQQIESLIHKYMK